MAQEPAPTMEAGNRVQTARRVYESLAMDREPYLRRARLCSSLTIPSLIREMGSTSASDLPTPFQSVGARGSNNLAEKLTLALFPPNTPFFKFRVDPYAADQVSGVPNAQQQIEANLTKAEEALLTEIETVGFRVSAHEAMRHLVVAGNCLVNVPKGELPRVFHLDQYVVERTPMGRPTQIIALEKLSESAMDADLLALVARSNAPATPDTSNAVRTDKLHDLYTWCRWDAEKGVWRVCQELDASPVPDSEAVYKPEDFPFFPLRIARSSFENYSRSYVEEYLGDLVSLEGLTQAIVEGSAAAAKILWLVNPAGMTDVNTLSKKANGAYAAGRADDVKAVGLEKFHDFNTAAQTASTIEQRLSQAFMLASSVQRDAERVTAEEIRAMIGELEQGLGGVYTLLSREFQLPVVQFFQSKMTRERRLPLIPKRVVKPTVITGIDALGRGNDLNRLNQATAAVVEALGPQSLPQYLDGFEYVKRVFTAAGIRTDGLVKDPSTQVEAQNNAVKQSMIEKLGPAAIQAVSRTMQAQGQGAAGQVQPSPPQAQ